MGAFYVFPNFSSYFGKTFNGKVIDGSVALADYFLDEARVATVPGAPSAPMPLFVFPLPPPWRSSRRAWSGSARLLAALR